MTGIVPLLLAGFILDGLVMVMSSKDILSLADLKIACLELGKPTVGY